MLLEYIPAREDHECGGFKALNSNAEVVNVLDEPDYFEVVS